MPSSSSNTESGGTAPTTCRAIPVGRPAGQRYRARPAGSLPCRVDGVTWRISDMRPRTAGRLVPAVLAILYGLYFGPGIVQGAATPTAPAASPPAPVAWQAATSVGAAPAGTANQGSVSAVVTPWATAAGSLTAAAPITGGAAAAATPASAGPNGAQPNRSRANTIFADL